MRQISHIVLMGILTASVAGCALLPGGEDTAVVEPVPETSPTAEAPVVQPFTEPGVVDGATPTGIVPPDLISATDPSQRAQSVNRERSDPFALLPATPTIQVPPSPPVSQAPQTVPQLPNLPRPSQQAPGQGQSPAGQGQGRSAPGSLAPIPNLVPGSPGGSIAAQPRTDLASAVLVTGVVQIGDTVHAIVDAPNEPTSRYVRVGQRLSNGQVLVKRIEMNEGAEPVVILEQDGVEIVRAVGEGGSAAATASIQTGSGNRSV